MPHRTRATFIVMLALLALFVMPAFAMAVGTISGHVSNSSAADLNEIEVTAFWWDGSAWQQGGTTYTGSNGLYTLSSLTARDYIVRFDDPEELYMMEYFDDALTPEDAEPITVVDGGTADVDAVLSRGGHITGTVTAVGGSALEGIVVDAYLWNDAGGTWDMTGMPAYTAANGFYDLEGLATGDYRVGFSDYSAAYLPEFYDDADTVDEADSVSVTADTTTPNINVALTGAGHIAGVVTSDGTQGISSAYVEVYAFNETLGWWELTGWSAVSEEGAYDIGGLGTGGYLVKSRDTTVTYEAEYFDNIDDAGFAQDPEFGDSVAVEGGETTIGIDFIMGPLGDATAPTVTSDAQAAYRGSATITLTGADAGGFEEIFYSLDGAAAIRVKDDVAVIHIDYAAASSSAGVAAAQAHTLEFWGADRAANGSQSQSVSFEIAEPLVRVAGTDRYATAIEASKRAYPDGAGTVIIATGANWPDALGGSALAGAAEGPLLLTQTDALPATVKAEIERLDATTAYILGGTGAVGGAVEAELKGLLGTANVERLAGTDRYGTAQAVGAQVIAMLGDGYDGNAFVATGGNFPDALAGSPIAAAKGWPILLAHPVTGGIGVPDAVARVAILGGTGAVSSNVQAALSEELGAPNVTRYGGVNRYATARMVADFGVASGLGWDGVGIATGENFPDALSGGAMLGAFDSVMLLTPTATLDAEAATALTAHAAEIDTVYLIGGTGAVSAAVETAVNAALGL